MLSRNFQKLCSFSFSFKLGPDQRKRFLGQFGSRFFFFKHFKVAILNRKCLGIRQGGFSLVRPKVTEKMVRRVFKLLFSWRAVRGLFLFQLGMFMSVPSFSIAADRF